MNIPFAIFLGLALVASVYCGGKEIRSRPKGKRGSFLYFLLISVALIVIMLLVSLDIISSQLFLPAILIVAAAEIGYLFVKEGVKETLRAFVKGKKFFLQSVGLTLGLIGMIGIRMLPGTLIPNWAKDVISGFVFYIVIIEFLKILLINEGREKASGLEKLKREYGNVKGEVLFVMLWMAVLPIAMAYFLSIPFIDAAKKVRERI